MADIQRESGYALSKAKNDAADVSTLLYALRDELRDNLILTTVLDVAIAKIWESVETITEVIDRDYPGTLPQPIEL